MKGSKINKLEEPKHLFSGLQGLMATLIFFLANDADCQIRFDPARLVEHAGVDSLACVHVHLVAEDPVCGILGALARQVELAKVGHVEQSRGRAGSCALGSDLTSRNYRLVRMY